MSDKAEERRRFISESAREFIARRFHSAEGLMPETIPEAVRLASQLADELEKQDAAPWSRTIDVNSLVDSVPALPMPDDMLCNAWIGPQRTERCRRLKNHKGLHKGLHKSEHDLYEEG